MTPFFIHITSTGGIWISNNLGDTPAGSILATFRVNSGAKFQQIGTISASGSALSTVSGGTGKQGKEIV